MRSESYLCSKEVTVGYTLLRELSQVLRDSNCLIFACIFLSNFIIILVHHQIIFINSKLSSSFFLGSDRAAVWRDSTSAVGILR